MSVRTLDFMLLVMWFNTCTRTIKTAFVNNCSCRLFGSNVIHTEWNPPLLVCYHLSVEQLFQIWETVGRHRWLIKPTHIIFHEGWMINMRHPERIRKERFWMTQMKGERRVEGLSHSLLTCPQRQNYSLLCVHVTFTSFVCTREHPRG